MLNAVALRNEWRVLRRHPLVWLVLAGACAFSLLVATGSPGDPGATAAEALLRLNLFIPAFMLPFMAGALAPSAYLREVEWGLDDIVGSYPLGVRQWLVTRLGHLLILLLAACLVAETVFVVVLAQEFASSLPALLAQAALCLAVIHAPACLLWASALAWLASRRAHAGLLYFAAGIGWLAYLGLATMTGTPLIAGSITAWAPLKQAMLVLDPYAATALVNPVPEDGLLQWRWLNVAVGRFIWIGAALLLLRSVTRVPALAAHRTGTPRSDRAGLMAHRDSRPGHVGLHLRYLVRDRVFPLLVLGWFALFLPEVVGGMDYAEPLSRIAPDSRDALNRVVWDVLPLAGALLLVYAADRLCRMYQTTRMNELYAATPHPPLALIAAQVASLGSVALGSVVLTGVAVAGAQLVSGSPVDPGEYGAQLGLAALPLVLLALLLVAIHAAIRSRLLANLCALLLVVVGQSSLAPALGLHHPLWKVLATPLAAPDHLWGYGRAIDGHVTFLAFWATLAAAALLIAGARSHRTLPAPQVRLVRTLRHPASLVAASFLILAGWQGLAIDRTLEAEGALTPPDTRIRQRADYERNYARWNHVPQPDVEAVRAQVDIFPEEGKAALRATMRLINRSGQPVTEILVGAPPGGPQGGIAVEQAAIARHDARLGQTVFRLERPMLPGERRELTYRGDVSRSGLQAATFPLVLHDRFSSLPGSALLPVVGFKRELTPRDPKVRREQELPELKAAEPSRLGVPAPGMLARDRVMVEAVISTSAGHFGIGQGRLLRRWETDGRAYFHYRSEAPIRSALAFFSVAGEPQSWPAGRVTVWTHTPAPLGAKDVNILGARDTLDLLDRAVAPYPGSDFHLLAIPEIGPSGYALPQIVQVSHRLAFLAAPAPGAGFNQAYRRAAHETAHQWFGHLLGHGVAEERAFLVESLAKYAELVVIERRYGAQAAAALVVFERDRYRQARLDPDRAVKPLIDADETEDMYSRATLSFACLRHRIGDAPILAALRSVTQDMQVHDRPATSLGFVRALKAASPSGQGPAIDALFLGTRPIQSLERDLGCLR